MSKQTKVPEDKIDRYRKLHGLPRWIQIGVSSLIVVLGLLFILKVHVRLGIGIYTEQWIGIFLTLFLFNTFFSIPASKRSPREHLPWYDYIFAILSLPVGIYIAIKYPTIIFELGTVTTERVVLGTLLVLLLLEAARRIIGISIVIIAAVFFLYALYGNHLPEAIASANLSWGHLVNFLYLDHSSTLSLLNLAATYGLAFVFFGQVLLKFGGGEGLTNVALLLFGRTRGGPAKAAVVGSTLIGTVTGAPMSNVFLSGSVTIPLMIRSGYRPQFAASVEAVASSGGAITPPVMGIAAFMIAERLGIPYADVAIAAIIPAFLFYLAVFIQVDLEAGKFKLRKLKKEEVPSKSKTISMAWPVVSVLLILILALFVIRLPAATAAVYASLLGIFIFIIVKENRRRLLQKLWEIVEDSSKMLLDVGSALGVAGLIVGIVNISGLGFTIGYALTAIGENSLFFLLLAAAIGSLILGMGLPSVAAYALVAVLVGPALVDFGVNELAAHLFIYYFAMLSSFTPPIAFATFAASFLAGTHPIKTSLTSAKLGTLAYIMPFIFVYNPSLILQGSIMETIFSLLTAIVGALILGAGIVGYLLADVSIISRLLLIIAGFALIFPISGFDFTLVVNIIGFIIAAIIALISLKNRNRIIADQPFKEV